MPKVKAAEILPTENDHVILTLKADGALFLDETQVDAAVLEDALKNAVGSSQKQLFLRADKQVPHGRVMEVMGSIRSAGVDKSGHGGGIGAAEAPGQDDARVTANAHGRAVCFPRAWNCCGPLGVARPARLHSAAFAAPGHISPGKNLSKSHWPTFRTGGGRLAAPTARTSSASPGSGSGSAKPRKPPWLIKRWRRTLPAVEEKVISPKKITDPEKKRRVPKRPLLSRAQCQSFGHRFRSGGARRAACAVGSGQRLGGLAEDNRLWAVCRL